MSLAILHQGALLRYSSACADEGDLLLRLRHDEAANKFRLELWNDRCLLTALVRQQLNLTRHDACTISPKETWLQGAFNICVVVEVKSRDLSSTKYIIRCPMPHKFAEEQHPGTIDEKVCCEVASYVWIQEHCKDIRIPHLHGFGLTTGYHFTHINHKAWYQRVYHSISRWIYRTFRLPLLSNYTRNTLISPINTAYLLLEYIGPEIGQMLSTTWAQHQDDILQRTRLYRGMARIILSLARIPQASIGSYRFNHDCTVTLTNRPLSFSTVMMENIGTPRTIPPDQTYPNVDSFTSDMLTLYDNYLLQQPHAVRSENDARERFTIRLMLRALSHHFIRPCQRSGPFLLQLTDLHQSNIFVDPRWNITGIVDLEWICSLPADAISVPYWLTSCGIDGLTGKEYDRFDVERQRFLAALNEENKDLQLQHDIDLMRNMEEVWSSKGVWFWACLRSINSWPFLFEDHLLAKFSTNTNLVTDLKQASAFWMEDIESIVKRKVVDEHNFKNELKISFEKLAQDRES